MKRLILMWSIGVAFALSGSAQDSGDPFGGNPGAGAGGGGLGGGGYGGGAAGGGLGAGGDDPLSAGTVARMYGGVGGGEGRVATWHAVNVNHNTLIVGSGDVTSKTRSEILEDSAIMQRLLSKHTGTGTDLNNVGYAMGINVHTLNSGAAGNVLHLEGFGMVFPLQVNYALVAPLNADDTRSETKTETEWDRARQELYGRRMSSYSRPKPRKASYDAQKVERLKSGVISALQNASNLRHVSPDEHIVVVVTGAARELAGDPMVQMLNSAYVAGGVGRNSPNSGAPVVINQVSLGAKTVMTFKVKKGDVDKFASDGMDSEDFEQRVSVTSY